jgi:hypothetical protein
MAAASVFSLCLLSGCKGGDSSDESVDTGTEVDSGSDDSSDDDDDFDDDDFDDDDIDDDDDGCSADQVAQEEALVRKTIRTAEPCFSGGIKFRSGEPSADVRIVMDEGEVDSASETPLGIIYSGDGKPPMAQKVEQVLSDGTYDCKGQIRLAVVGGLTKEVLEVESILKEQCPEFDTFSLLEQHHIIINPDGTVNKVVPQCEDEWCVEVAQCIDDALDGLVFPCLGGFELYHEVVVIII